MPKGKLHVFIMLFFAAIAIFLTLGRVGTAFRSFALLTPDLGVYASIAAAQDSPELFVRDPFLSNEKNINSYNMVYLPAIRALKKIFGNYGTACAFLLPFFIFIHLVGFYVLGISIFKNPWAGLLVSLLLSAPTFTLYDYWGLILDALPRFLYQGLIPFLLALAIKRGSDLKWWPVILGGAGLLNYIHPLSTPPWTLAILLSLWVSAPEISFWKKTRSMALASIMLMFVLFPFVMNYLKSTILEAGNVLVSYDETLAILQSRLPGANGSNPVSALMAFFVERRGVGFDAIWYFVWLLGIAGILFGLTWRKDSDDSKHLRKIAAWIAGIFIVSGLLPVLERIIFAYLRRIPPEFEILRTLRYLVPLVLLAAFYAVWLAKEYLQRQGVLSSDSSQYLLAGAGAFLLLVWGSSSELQWRSLRGPIQQNLSCWSQGKMICPLPESSMDFIDIMNVVREETPVGARIFSEGQEVAVRYYALRPLVFTYKDGAPLAYTDQKQLLTWNRLSQRMEEIAFLRKFSFRHKAFIREIVGLARDTDSDFLILHEPYRTKSDYPPQLSLIHTNAHYSLYKLNP